MPDISIKNRHAGVSKPWFVYMVRCADGSLYAGITVGLAARIAKHNAGSGAKYTRGRGPVELVWKKKLASGTEARKLEVTLKRLTKSEKERFVRA
jgi:putative endonuclease